MAGVLTEHLCQLCKSQHCPTQAVQGIQSVMSKTPALHDDDDDDTQVIKQSGRGGDPPNAVMESTRGADHSVMGPDGSEYQTAQQQQQQHVTDQLGNLSVHHGEACTQQGMI